MENPLRMIKAVVLNRRKDKVGSYISCIPVIDKLIEKDLLFVDIEKPYVAVSLRLHLAHIDDEQKMGTLLYRILRKIGLVERDSRYRSMMDHILGYINYHRAQRKLPVHSTNKRLDFMVTNLENTKPLLVGVYWKGEVDYRVVDED